MNKEEIKFYSIGRGSININGKFYYGLDYLITDFMNFQDNEKNKYKKALEYIKEQYNNILKTLFPIEKGNELGNNNVPSILIETLRKEIQEIDNIINKALGGEDV